jgi:hypothetical protein
MASGRGASNKISEPEVPTTEFRRAGFEACHPLEFKRRFGEKYCLHLQGRIITEAKKQAEIRSCETLRYLQTTRRHNPEDRTLYSEDHECFISGITVTSELLLRSLIIIGKFL